jgi:hypothetical protein
VREGISIDAANRTFEAVVTQSHFVDDLADAGCEQGQDLAFDIPAVASPDSVRSDGNDPG